MSILDKLKEQTGKNAATTISDTLPLESGGAVVLTTQHSMIENVGTYLAVGAQNNGSNSMDINIKPASYKDLCEWLRAGKQILLVPRFSRLSPIDLGKWTIYRLLSLDQKEDLSGRHQQATFIADSGTTKVFESSGYNATGIMRDTSTGSQTT